ncbi:MAG: hypothetical protein PSV35_09995, partial [bacterium]|nr:hypothetical protein [bacterium]
MSMHKSNGIVKTPMTNRNEFVNKFFKKIWMALAILIILAAIFSSVFRSLTPWAKQYKGEVELHLSQLLGQPITIQSMETGWYWFHPVIKLEHLTLREGSKTLHLEQLLIGINLFKSLLHRRLQPGILYINGMDLVLRDYKGRWQIDGLAKKDIQSEEMSPELINNILVLLSQQERLILRHISARFYFNNGQVIPLNDLKISLVNNGGLYKIKADARVNQKLSTQLKFLGDLYFDPDHINISKGHFYFSGKHIIVSQWQNFIPQIDEHMETGNADVALWFDVNKGMVSTAQAQIRLNHLSWRLLNTKKTQEVPTFYANLEWKKNNQGWQLLGNPIQLSTKKMTWPDNEFSILFSKDQNSYTIYIKSIIVESLLSDAINWPTSIKNILNIEPHGILTDTQVVIKNKQLNYVLSRFDQLGWNGQNDIPQIENLSGVLNWQPNEGHLELDSENTFITVKNYPTQKLTLFNGALYWKELSNGLRVSIDRFILNQPELTISAQGVIDQVSKNSLGAIRLSLDFT